MVDKQLYKVVVKYAHKAYIEYVSAYSEKQAGMLGIRRVAKKNYIFPGLIFEWLKKNNEKPIVQREKIIIHKRS